MGAHVSIGPYAHRPRSADTRSIGGALLGAGAISGVAAGMVMALDLPWTILRFGRLTEDPGSGRIDTVVRVGAPLTTSRDVAALAITEALARPHLTRQVLNAVDGERHVADALDAIEPLPLPPPGSHPARAAVPLGVAQADNPPTTPR